MVWKEPKSNYVASDEVTPEIFNELAENEKYLKEMQDTKITTFEVRDAVINNTIFSTRTNLTASEVLHNGFAKIRRWFSDLKGLAFKDVITESDISGTIAGTKINGAVAIADKATKMETARNIGLSGVTAAAQTFDGSTNITIPITAVPTSLLTGTASVSTTGNAGSATKLANVRTIGLSGVTATSQNFDGSANVVIPITSVPSSLLSGTASVSTTGNAATATTASDYNTSSGNILTKFNGIDTKLLDAGKVKVDSTLYQVRTTTNVNDSGQSGYITIIL